MIAPYCDRDASRDADDEAGTSVSHRLADTVMGPNGMDENTQLERSPTHRRSPANPRIRSTKHQVFDLTPAEWLDRYCCIGRHEDPLRGLEIVETLRVTGAKSRVARYACVGRDGTAVYLWAWERNYYLAEGFRSFEDARADAVHDLWTQFERLEGQWDSART